MIEEVQPSVSVIENAGGDDGDFWRMALTQDDDEKMSDEYEKMSDEHGKMLDELRKMSDEHGEMSVVFREMFDEFEEKYDVLGEMFDELGEMFDDLFAETKVREFAKGCEQVAVPSVTMGPQCLAMPSDEGHFVTLDSASDGHVAPSSYAGSCPRGSDAGPMLRDAQQAVIPLIPFVGQAVAPMRVLGSQAKNLLQAKMRLSDKIRKPTLSLCKLMDGGAKLR